MVSSISQERNTKEHSFGVYRIFLNSEPKMNVRGESCVEVNVM